NLILDSDNEKYQLIIPEKELTTLNVFPYITDTVVYSAKDRKIKNVYLKNKLLYQGNDYEIDDKNSHIYFYSPDFTALAGKGNGYTREYTLQEKVNPLILFINRKRAYNFSIKDNRLVFDKPPEYGANIHYYRYIPEIHVTKPIPGYETAICIDKQIECIEINLNTINYPDNAVILSDVSLYIYGKSSKKIAFFVNDDVYLGYIKSNSSISIFSRLIWLDFKQKNEIDLDHVYLFSEAEALYPLNFNAESIKNIRGAMTFLCRYKPFTQKKSEIEKYYFYHDDKFFKGYFQYADEFLNSPPLCAPFKIIKQRSQDKN
ncbi:MAG: hypothetical protein KKH98_15205, partial [Spirochaetes bacterium]|nr:hypothetical protein [Spirochaetota bacterium]